MSTNEEHNPQYGPLTHDDSLVIDTVRVEAERQRREQQEKNEQSRQRQAQHDRTMLRVTQGLFVATLITGIAALYQAHASSLSAEAALRAVKVAEDARDDSELSSGDILIQMKAQSRAMRRSASVAEENGRITKTAMERSERQSKAYLDGILQISRNEQRPYVVADRFIWSHGHVSATNPAIIDVVFRNVGKTQAVRVRSWSELFFFSAPPSVSNHLLDSLFQGPEPKYDERQDIAPGAAIAKSSYDRSLSTDEIKLLLKGEDNRLYFFGAVTYEEPSGTTHRTEFCVFFNGENLDLAHIAPAHNTIN